MQIKIPQIKEGEMTKEQEDYIKSNLKWPFSWEDIFFRYFILIAPIALIVLSFSIFYGDFNYEASHHKDFIKLLLLGLTIFFIGLLLMYFSIKRIKTESRFQILELNPGITFENIPEKIKSLKWTLVESSQECMCLNSPLSWFSWGEDITILKFDDNTILINSRPGGRQPFTMNRDKINFEKLKTLLKPNESRSSQNN